jgi:hypothetical protein
VTGGVLEIGGSDRGWGVVENLGFAGVLVVLIFSARLVRRFWGAPVTGFFVSVSKSSPCNTEIIIENYDAANKMKAKKVTSSSSGVCVVASRAAA